MLEPWTLARLLLLTWLLLTSLLLGARLTRRFIGVTEPMDVIGFSLTFAMLLVGVVGSWLGRINHHFPLPLIALGLLMSAPALIQTPWRPWRRTLGPERGRAMPEAGLVVSVGSAGRLTGRERVYAGLFGALAICGPVTMIWVTHLWDDWYFYLPLTSAFSRGILPVLNPFLPDRALTYHFGCAWLAGILEYLTGLSPEHCVDVVSTTMLVAFYLSAAATFRLWVGGRLAPYLAAAAVVCFSPLGWLWALFQAKGSGMQAWFLSWADETQTTFSDGIARPADYLLQKPMLAGMALVWAAMALTFVAGRRRDVLGAAVAGIAVGMLELFAYHTASLAALAGCGILGMEVLTNKGQRRIRLLMFALFAVAAFGLPRLNGGFAANPQGDAIVLERLWNFPFPSFVSYAGSHGLPIWVCYGLYYGASAVVLPVALFGLWRHRSKNTLWTVVFLLAAFAIPHLIRHHSSPVNITKFFQLSAFGLAILSAAGLLALTRNWSFGVRAPVLGIYLVAMSLSTWVSSYHMSRPISRGVVDAATVSSLRQVSRWLRAHCGTYDRAFALTDEVEAMSGVLSPLPPFAAGGRQLYTVTAHGYAPDYIASVKGLTDSAAVALDDASLTHLKIRWVVFPHPLPPTVGAEARERLKHAETFPLRHQTNDPQGGGWLIYEYLKGPPPGSLDP